MLKNEQTVIPLRNIPFSPPDISELEVENVIEVLKSGWITTGPKTKLLEARIAEWIYGFEGEGNPRCVCLNSATAALELALRILGIGEENGGSKEDEVITCAYTYTASASVIAHVGATIKLVDCTLNPESVQMDYDALEMAFSEKTKAVIPVDLGGIPCDYDRIFKIVDNKKNIFKPNSDIQNALERVAVVSDAAHAFGASYSNRMIGSIADLSAFSFHAVKNFTTAEGGALLWNSISGISDEEIYHLLQLYSLHGQDKDALAKEKIGGWEYDVEGLWYKCNMTDIMASIGNGQLDRYPEMLNKRKSIIEKYDNAFLTMGIESLTHYSERYISSGHLYLTRIPGISENQRNEIIEKMGEKGIACNVHYKPLPMMTAYKKLGFDIANYPNAYKRYQNEITLPLYTTLKEEDVEYIIYSYSRIIKEFM